MNDATHLTTAPLRAFTLIELLVVISIMVLLAVGAVPALQGLGGAQRFTHGIGQIAGIMEQARSYAVAQNTYVWVALYPYDPSKLTPRDPSGDALIVAVFASNDGTDPIDWSSETVAVPGTVADTSISQIFRIAIFKQTALRTENYFTQNDIASMPSQLTFPLTPPASEPTFTLSLPGVGSSPLSLPASLSSDAQTGQPISVIQFTPSGAARVGGSPVDSVWIDFQRAKAKGVLDADNIAALRIGGLTGLTTLYRK